MPNANQHDEDTTPDIPTQDLPANLQLEQDDLVIFGEDGTFYLVKKEQYTANQLPSPLMSAPEFAVGLGSMVSDITSFLDWDEPNRLIEKCACIVLNLAAIRQVNEKEDPNKPVTLFDDKGCEEEHGRGEPASNGRKADPDPMLGKNDLVIFSTDKKFYWVKEKEYLLGSKLPDVMRSAPELMVKLGTVLADIPNLPTAGCACYLLNLASLRKGSHYAARLLEENNLADRLRACGDPSAASSFSKKRAQLAQYLEAENEEAIARAETSRKALKPLAFKTWKKERRTLKKQDRAALKGKRGRHIVSVMKRSLFSVLRGQAMN